MAFYLEPMTMNEKMIPNLYQCADLGLTVVLSLYFPIVSINRQPNSHKAYFSFEQTKELTDLIQTYWRGELRIEPKTYFDQLRTIKARLYSEAQP